MGENTKEEMPNSTGRLLIFTVNKGVGEWPNEVNYHLK